MANPLHCQILNDLASLHTRGESGVVFLLSCENMCMKRTAWHLGSVIPHAVRQAVVISPGVCLSAGQRSGVEEMLSGFF